MTLAERLRAAMAEKGCTLTELASAVGVKPPSVSGWMTGGTRSLKADSALKAAKFLGVEAAWLAGGILPMRNVAQEHVSGPGKPIEPASTTADQEPSDVITIPDAPPDPEPEQELFPGLYLAERRTVARPPLTPDEHDVLDGYRVASEADRKQIRGICLVALSDHERKGGGRANRRSPPSLRLI